MYVLGLVAQACAKQTRRRLHTRGLVARQLAQGRRGGYCMRVAWWRAAGGWRLHARGFFARRMEQGRRVGDCMRAAWWRLGVGRRLHARGLVAHRLKADHDK